MIHLKQYLNTQVKLFNIFIKKYIQFKCFKLLFSEELKQIKLNYVSFQNILIYDLKNYFGIV
uniref:Uncharacterized protein n=1 Tax=viral metagenome TaxID=1070528 RepID=A0A6C0H835_9ZZZZ